MIINMAWKHAPVGDSLLLSLLPSNSLSPFSFSLLDPHTPTVAVDLIPCGASPRRPSRFIPRFDRHSTCLIRSLLFLFLFRKNIISNFRFPFLALPSTRLDPRVPFGTHPIRELATVRFRLILQLGNAPSLFPPLLPGLP